MATKKYLSLERLADYDELIKAEIKSGDESTLSSAKSYTDTKVSSITNGDVIVKEAEHSTSADSAANADHSVSSDSATKATQDASGNVITDTYETKTDAQLKYDELTAIKAEKNHSHSWNDLEDRPFGDIPVVYIDCNPEMVRNYSDKVWQSYHTENINGIIETGKTYNVTIDGVIYENLTCIQPSGSDPYLGSSISDLENGTGEYPFGVYWNGYYKLYNGYFADDKEHHIKVEESVLSVKQIEEKFIPDSIARTYHTHSWNDLEDKPFGDINNVLYSTDTTLRKMDGTSETSAILSDFDVSIFQFNKDYTIKVNDYTFVLKWQAMYGGTKAFQGYTENGDYFYLYNSGGATSEVRFEKKEWDDGTELTPKTYDVHIDISDGKYTKQIEEKYIPDEIARTTYVDENFALKSDLQNIDLSSLETKEDAQLKYDELTAIKAEKNHSHSWNELEDKPFGEGEMFVTYVDGEPQNVNGSDGQYRGWIDEYSGLKGIIKPGQSYNLTFDGVLYENIMCYGEEGACYLGISEDDFHNDTNTEYPCSVNYTDYYDEYFIGLRDDAPHTIKIEALEFGVKQIDAKYVSNLVGKNVCGVVFDIDGTDETALKGAEIFNDYEENKATGQYAHAEGQHTIAYGDWSHAEGIYTKAYGQCAHAEGEHTSASGHYSHTEGGYTTASGNNSHAEGRHTTASGHYSHVEGYSTKASSQYQHVQGIYNVEDTSNTYAHIVGNGEAYNKLSNAHTLDWSGNAWFAGNIRVGGTEYDNGSEVALKSDLANIDLSKYETKTDSQSKLDEAKAYADSAASTVKNDLLNGAGAAYDTLKELGELIVENKDAIDVLEDVATGKADAVHSHAISEVSGLQSALDGKADASHGTHVSYSTTAPVMDGTASVGSASTVARSDHRHPTDTSRASQTDLDNHIADSTKHITSTERTNWNTAKSHADSAHAPSNAQANVIESIKVNGATQIITSKSVDITVPTDATDIGAAPATHGHAISDITDLQTTLNNAANAISTNTGSIEAHTARISALETKVGDGFEEITSAEIQALFA